MEKTINGIIKIAIMAFGMMLGIINITSSFKIACNQKMIFLCLIGILLIYVFIYRTKRRWLYYGLLLVYFIYIGKKGYTYIRVGILDMANVILRRYYDYFDVGVLSQYDLGILQGTEGSISMGTYHTVAICWIMIVVSSVLLLFTWQTYYVIPHIIWILFSIGFPAVLGKLPSKEIMAGFVIYAMCCFAFRGDYWISRLRLKYILGLGMVAYVLAVIIINPVEYENSEFFLEMRLSVKDVINQYNFDELLQSKEVRNTNSEMIVDKSWASGGDSGGNLGRVDSVRFTEEPMLRIGLEEIPAVLYLKGYTANRYTGKAWYPVVNKNVVLDDMNEILQGKDVEEFFNMGKNYVQGQLLAGESTISIWKYKNNNGNDIYYYPYFSKVHADRYTYDMCAFENNLNYKDALNEAEQEGLRKKNTLTYAPVDILEIVNMLQERGENIDNADLPEYYKQYEEYVYDTCLDVPRRLQKLFKKLIPDAPRYQKNDIASMLACVAYVQKYLRENTSYSLHPGKTQGSDFVEEFLTVKKTGYCTSYASTAALMLRYMGIPARYATGYVVYRSDIEAEKYDSTTSEYIIDVRDSSAHAWAEVFAGPLGFIPVETTPDYYSGEAGNDTEENNSVNSSTTASHSESEPGEEDTTKSPEPDSTGTGKETEESTLLSKGSKGTGQQGSSKLPLYLAGGVLVVLAIIFVIIFAGKKQLPLPEQEVEEADRIRKGIEEAGMEFFAFLEKNGIQYKDGWILDSSDLIQKLLKLYKGKISREESEEFLEIYQRAKYSARTDKFLEKEYEKVVEYVDKCKNSLQSDKK